MPYRRHLNCVALHPGYGSTALKFFFAHFAALRDQLFFVPLRLCVSNLYEPSYKRSVAQRSQEEQ